MPKQGARTILIALGVACLAAALVHVAAGGADAGSPLGFRMSPLRVLEEILAGPGGSSSSENVIVWQIRLERALACLLGGALLGSVGSAFQALFRNPLADPYIVGVSSGAAVGGALAMALGVAGFGGSLGLMGFAFAGGFAALSLVMALGRTRGVLDVSRLLLAGVVVGSMLSALLYLIVTAMGLDANQFLRWLLGSATPMYWDRLALMGVATLIGIPLLMAQTKRMNALAMGEETAKRLGVDVKRLQPTILVVGAAMVSVTVGAMGIIGFLGLVAPHIARRLVGVDWRQSLMGSALIGSLLLLISDVVAQRALGGAEIQVGVVTAILGAPFLLALLRKPEGA